VRLLCFGIVVGWVIERVSWWIKDRHESVIDAKLKAEIDTQLAALESTVKRFDNFRERLPRRQR